MSLALEPDPTSEDVKGFGYRDLKEYNELVEPKEIVFDEELMDAWDVYCAMATQWRIGMNGATGLDYNALPFIMDTYKISDREATLNDLRIMEAHHLAVIREMQERKQKTKGG